jgi:hypothetical protein
MLTKDQTTKNEKNYPSHLQNFYVMAHLWKDVSKLHLDTIDQPEWIPSICPTLDNRRSLVITTSRLDTLLTDVNK